MSTYRLETLFSPRSVAVVGGSPRAASPGRAVLANLQRGGFAGPIGLVNPHYAAIEGVAAVKSYAALAQTPELVVIAVPPAAVPAIVGEAATLQIRQDRPARRGSARRSSDHRDRTRRKQRLQPVCRHALGPRRQPIAA